MALPLSYNARNLLVRWKVTLLAIFGIALVVTVLVTLTAMSKGFQQALAETGSPDNGIIVQRGSGSELTSFFSREHRNLLEADERIARGADGKPLASPDIVIVANLKRKADGEPTNVTVRGVTPVAFQVRRGLAITAGRNFTPGLNEIIVGEKIARRMAGLDLGSKVAIQKRDWTVVGWFSANGSAFESEIWGDYDVMGPAFLRGGGQNSLTVRLKDPKTLHAFDQEIQANPQMQLEMKDERQYYADQSGPVSGPLLVLATFVSLFMGIGAVFGAINTMNAIVAARTREIGTLRALGFSRRSILGAFLIESLLLALVGGALGCLLAFPMNGYTAGTGQTQSFSEIAFAFRVTPGSVLAGLLLAVGMGLVGGLVPAIRAARLPITTALREG
ncbi:MAG TPA: ABC transporter permease [Candidatus Polarisedimenticolia bacterium]|jgi:ABC-type antimicrobial peptide transport system permease subunit|nr:ABC transporter permease [Candidatus Polarisedimenticolia bacterium]